MDQASNSTTSPGASFPDFFAQAPVVVVRDDLAAFLGAADDGIIEYRYADAVRLAGHSCPTVATAFLMARAGLRQLFPAGLPARGEIRVACRAAKDAGVAGVMASVFTLLTGAAEEGGFRGLGPRFGRRNLLSFAQPCAGEFRLARLDNHAAVDVWGHAERVASDPRLRELMPLCLGGEATAAQAQLFRDLWQARVRKLLELADDPELIVVAPAR